MGSPQKYTHLYDISADGACFSFLRDQRSNAGMGRAEDIKML
jgi:hypothetical protein